MDSEEQQLEELAALIKKIGNQLEELEEIQEGFYQLAAGIIEDASIDDARKKIDSLIS